MTGLAPLALALPLLAPIPETAAEIDAIAARLAADYEITVAWQPWQVVPIADVTIDWADRDDLGRLVRYARWFDEEWRRYPRELVDAAGLRQVWLVEGVDSGDGERVAYPGYDVEVLVYQFPEEGELEEHEAYYRQVVHHELFHMLEEEWNGDGYHHDDDWAAVNPFGFAYDPGVPDELQGLPASHPAHGIVSYYAATSMTEDRAEVWGLMLDRSGWRKLDAWRRVDTVLAAKVALHEAFVRRHVPTCDAAWWRGVREPPPAASANDGGAPADLLDDG